MAPNVQPVPLYYIKYEYDTDLYYAASPQPKTDNKNAEK